MKKAYIFAAVSIFCWSTVATVVKLLLGSFTSLQVLSVSALFGAIFLLILNIITGNIKNLRAYRPMDYIITLLIGIPGTFLYYIFYYTGTSMMLASQAFIINYLWPIMSVLFACIILKERMTVRRAIAIVISFIGVIIVAGGDFLTSFNTKTLLGALFCILGAVSYGVFTALNQKKKYEKRLSLMLSYFLTFTLTTVINAVSGNLPRLGAIEVVGLAYNGIFTMAIAGVSWLLALNFGKTAKISNLAYITPFLSLVWTGIFLGEKISLFSLLGLAVIVFGIFVQLFEKKPLPKIK